jgi:hypothetical protein
MTQVVTVFQLCQCVEHTVSKRDNYNLQKEHTQLNRGRISAIPPADVQLKWIERK